MNRRFYSSLLLVVTAVCLLVTGVAFAQEQEPPKPSKKKPGKEDAAATGPAPVELFRAENVPLETEEAKLGQQYQKLSGSLTVQFRGEEKTLIQMGLAG